MSHFFVLAGPSGVGKTTLINAVMQAKPSQIVHPITHTTRALRPGEVNGRDMISIPRSQFTPRLLGGDYLAHTEYHGEYYGTLRQDIRQGLEDGKRVVVAFDEAGIDCLKNSRFPAVFIWLAAPNGQSIAQWLQKRWPQMGPEYEKRLVQAIKEYERFETDKNFRKKFDYWILSRDLNEMTSELLELMGF